ncbi:D-aminoacyl-tRNA deacylase 1 isoform X1 [Chelonia mydas]|uniref:D-aminoacyl-tRNA deacylase 1 isoform X1 n=1 Tax=Chelonia mydas TaxID=8469 RepID=UPI0018A20771|nr:D-aminoacyl-tRNA deacylase 1 isoform X1 [Chelonia mydas]
MKAIIQRVTQASVTVGGEQISSIGRGICVLLGISLEDTHKELEHMVRKILNLRVFEDESGKHWSKSVMDKQYEVLCVSQFTLQCILKGNKPDYHMAMPAEQAESFYNNFLEQLKKAYKPELIKDGKFGAYMQVNIQNDGPVTIELESPAATTDPKQNCILLTVPGLRCCTECPVFPLSLLDVPWDSDTLVSRSELQQIFENFVLWWCACVILTAFLINIKVLFLSFCSLTF